MTCFVEVTAKGPAVFEQGDDVLQRGLREDAAGRSEAEAAAGTGYLEAVLYPAFYVLYGPERECGGHGHASPENGFSAPAGPQGGHLFQRDACLLLKALEAAHTPGLFSSI